MRLSFTGEAQISVSSASDEKESDELRHDRSELADLLNVSTVSDVRSQAQVGKRRRRTRYKPLLLLYNHTRERLVSREHFFTFTCF